MGGAGRAWRSYGYITKPFDRDEIVDGVASALQYRQELLLARDSQ